MIESHNQMNEGAKQGDFWGQEKLTLSHNEMHFVTKRMTFWDRRN